MKLCSAIAFLAGCSAKTYDDLTDNPRFRSSKKKNKTFIEGLKGVHYISFTTVSLQSPVFFLVNYFGNSLAYLTDDSSYTKPYERSLKYSFLILFLPILYQISQHGLDITCNYMNIFFIIMCGVFAVGESYIFTEDVSFRKLISRIIVLLFLLCSVYLFSSDISDSLIYIFIYFVGYMLISIFVQYYSLFIYDKKKIIKYI